MRLYSHCDAALKELVMMWDQRAKKQYAGFTSVPVAADSVMV